MDHTKISENIGEVILPNNIFLLAHIYMRIDFCLLVKYLIN